MREMVQVKKDFDTIKELAIDKEVPIQVMHMHKWNDDSPYCTMDNYFNNSCTYVKNMTIEQIKNSIKNNDYIFVYIIDRSEEDTTNGKEKEQ